MILVDLSVASSAPHLLAALFLARANDDQLALSREDLHHLYWHSGGLHSAPGYNEAFDAFSKFFDDHRDVMRAALPEDPSLMDAAACVVLVERAINAGWATLVPPTWGEAELMLMRLFGLPISAIDGLNDWSGTLYEFLELPWAGREYDYFDPRVDALFAMGDEASSLVLPPANPRAEMRDLLLELARADSERQPRSADWYLVPFTKTDTQAPVALRPELRNGALLGMEAVLDGAGEYFTRSRTVQDVLKQASTSYAPLIADNPRMKDSLAGPLAALRKDMRVDDAFELLTHARTLELLSELLAMREGERQSTTKAYVNNLADLYLPKPLKALSETMRFIVRRRRLP